MPTRERFEDEVERYIGQLFEGRVGGSAFATCLHEQPAPGPYLRKMLEVADAAVQARVWFGKFGPIHLQPLPLVFYEEGETILCSGDFPRHLTFYYSNSLQHSQFRYLEHPLFFDYARGVMADPNGPDYLQDDPELLAEFPPKPLPGLDGTIWSPPPKPAAAGALR